MNAYLFKLINAWAGESYWLDQLMIFCAEWLGYLFLLGLLAYVLMDRKKYWRMTLVSLSSAIIARFVFVEAIRFFYYNSRPFLVFGDVIQLVNHETTSSFPSGHAAFYFALAMGIYLYNKKMGLVYLGSAVLIGFSRIFSGVHWPLDVIGGMVLGIGIASGVSSILEFYLKRRSIGLNTEP